MNVLHIWNQAGVSSLLAKYQNLIGYESAVIQQTKHDPTGISKYYGNVLYQKKSNFLFHCLSASRLYDIIHLHDAWFMVVPLSILYPRKKIIMHYHGSLVRNNTLGKMRLKNERLVNKILVATPDLLEYEYTKPPFYLPDPIDDQLFAPRTITKNSRGFAWLKHTQQDEQLRSLLISKNFPFHLETRQRIKGMKNGLPYYEMPDFLSNYEYYIDIPIINDKLIKANSCLGLQCMSLGLKVVSWDFSIKSKLPEQHKPENVVKKLDEIYQSL